MTFSSQVEPRVSVILPCRNERAHIEACLASTLNQMPPPGGFEVIVADGMSDDGTREILQRLAFNSQPSTLNSQLSPRPLIRIIDNPARIASAGLNAAIRAARGEVIVRMDAHTEYSPDYVRECVAALAQTGADNVGGPARTQAQTFIERAVSAAYHSSFAVGGAKFHDVDYEGFVDTVTYGCWPRSTFEKFGLFDEELVRNQDDEHNLRITRGGGKIYQSPRIKSWYRPRGSLGALFRQYMQYGYWKVRVIQKHKLPASWRHLVPGAFVLTLLCLFLLTAFSFLASTLITDHRLLITYVFSFSTALLSLVLGTYALALISASLITARKNRLFLFPVLPLVFACYHFGYGIGFLRGILDFAILRRGASATFGKLTRSSAELKT